MYISRVEEGSVAERAGLRPGDSIMQVNGTPFSGISHEDALKVSTFILFHVILLLLHAQLAKNIIVIVNYIKIFFCFIVYKTELLVADCVCSYIRDKEYLWYPVMSDIY